MKQPDYLFAILDIFYILGIIGLMKLATAFNCHEQSDYNKHLIAKNEILNIVVKSYEKDDRYKWALRNKDILKHIKNNHPDLSFKKFIELAYKGELYLN